MRNLIVAYDREGAIGKDNDLLWKPGEMKADMRRFRQLTMNSTLIMGRKTLESIGFALPRRRNIVISRDPDFSLDSVETAHSLTEAFNLAGDENTYVIGGSSVYAQSLPLVDTIYATEVDASFSDADSFFPKSTDEDWNETSRDKHVRDENNIYNYEFVTYERK
jgi:dihydrofolate reductase